MHALCLTSPQLLLYSSMGCLGYRIHETPAAEKQPNSANSSAVGLSLGGADKPSAKDYQI